MHSRKTLWFLMVLLAYAVSAQGQWNIVAPKLTRLWLFSGAMQYHNGVVWIANDPSLYISTDSGLTWTTRSLPTSGFACDVQFYSSTVGVLASTGGAYMTYDGGVTWQVLRQSTAMSACFLNNTNSVSISGGASFSGITTNGGQTWNNLPNGNYGFCTRYKSGTVYEFAGSQYGAYIFTSNDHGANWQQANAGIDWDSFTFAVDSCDLNRIYLSHEDCAAPTDLNSKIFLSTDRGNTWQTVVSHPEPFFTGSMVEGLSAIYCQSIANGVFRSTDRGQTWSSIGGPSLRFDTRMIAAISDNILLGVDDSGNVWRTMNSGGDSVTTPLPQNYSFIASPPSLFTLDTLSCDSLTHAVAYFVNGCPAPTISSTSIVGTDASSYRLAGVGPDSIHVTLYNTHFGSQSGKLVLTLNNGARDTIALGGYVASIRDTLVVSPSKLFTADTINCDSVSHTVFLHRTGCPPLVIVTASVTGKTWESYDVKHIWNDSLQVTFRNAPATKPGAQSGQLVLVLTNGSNDTVSLAGFVRASADTLIASPTILFATDTLSCDSLSRSVTLSSSGCYAPTVLDAIISGSNAKSYRVASVGTNIVSVKMFASNAGAQQADLILYLSNGSEDTITLAGFVGPAANKLEIPSEIMVSAQDGCTGSVVDGIPLTILGCSSKPEILDSIWFTGSVNFSLSDPRHVPRNLASSDSIRFAYEASGANDTSQLHILYDIGSGKQDTSVNIIGIPSPFSSEGSAGIHRESAASYFGSKDSLPLTVDIAQSISLDSLWTYISDIKAVYTWDSSIVHYIAYLAPTGWSVNSIKPLGNSVSFSIHDVSASYIYPLNLGTAVFLPSHDTIAASWVTLPQLNFAIGGKNVGLCVADNEDNHWVVKTLVPENSVGGFSADMSLTIYPDPTTGTAYLLSNTDLGYSSIEIYNALGNQALKIEAEIARENPLELLLPAASGVYTIVVRSVHGTQYLRVIKER